MQRPATIRHRTSLFEDATAIVEAEYAADLSPRRHRPPRRLVAPPAPARLRRDRQHDLPRAPDRGAHGARRRACSRSRGADRPRGRPPRRLPPAGPVRQGVPPPPRRLALDLPRRARPLERLRRRLAHRRRSPPERAADRCRAASSGDVPRCALSRTTHRMPPGMPRGEHAAARAQAHRPADGRRRRHRLGDRHRPRPGDPLVPAGRTRRRRTRSTRSGTS